MNCETEDCVFHKDHSTKHSFEYVGHSRPMTQEEMSKLTFEHGNIDSFLDMLRKIHEWHIINDMSCTMNIVMGKDL